MLKSWLVHWPLTDWPLEGDEKVEGKGIKILSLNIPKDSLQGSLNQAFFVTKSEFPKILVPRLPQNTSNVNTEWVRKSKQLYSLCDQLLGALTYLCFIALMLICF